MTIVILMLVRSGFCSLILKILEFVLSGRYFRLFVGQLNHFKVFKNIFLSVDLSDFCCVDSSLLLKPDSPRISLEHHSILHYARSEFPRPKECLPITFTLYVFRYFQQ